MYSQKVIDRFWSKIDQSGGLDACWEWQAGRTPLGYGHFACFRGEQYRPSRKAHRVAWEMVYGEIPENINCLHTCDNPPCCNPLHLYLGTQRENSKDAWARGRNSGCKGKHWKWTEEQKAAFSAKLRLNSPRPCFHALSDEKKNKAKAMHNSGMSLRSIGRYFDVTHSTIKRAIKD